MSVIAGHIDSLLSETFPWFSFPQVAVQNATGSSGAGADAAPSAVSVLTTSGFAQGVTPTDELTVVGIDDTNNTLTFSVSDFVHPATQFTDYILGYSTATVGTSADSYLLSTEPASVVDPLLDQGQYAAASSDLAVLPLDIVFPNTAITYSLSSQAILIPGLGAVDTSTGQAVVPYAEPYRGPVVGLEDQYVNLTSDNLNISASTADWFIHSGSGTDAIAVSYGNNVLDGGTGSNFLSGGSGTDNFFVDARGAASDIWSTVNDFHLGDAATIWGISPSDFTVAWADGQGASGYTGLTMHATAYGRPTASLTLVGYSQADLSNGRLSVSFGTSGGSAYMYLHENH